MAEVEIHAEHVHVADSVGRRVGVAVGIIGIVLAAVTISSHREHTAAVIHRTEANDKWSFYQAKKIRQEMLEVGVTTMQTLSPQSTNIEPATTKMKEGITRYGREAEGIQKEAKEKEEETEHAEYRALRFDLGEGFLELGLVLCSLYFLSKKQFFPVLGGVAAVAGTLFSVLGWLM